MSGITSADVLRIQLRRAEQERDEAIVDVERLAAAIKEIAEVVASLKEDSESIYFVQTEVREIAAPLLAEFALEES